MATVSLTSSFQFIRTVLILAGILVLGSIGLINIFYFSWVTGLVFVTAALVFLRVYVWIEKYKLGKLKRKTISLTH